VGELVELTNAFLQGEYLAPQSLDLIDQRFGIRQANYLIVHELGPRSGRVT
jgi:hypothetical protein